MEEAAPEVFEEPFEDWPIEGPRTVLHSLRTLRRQGDSWLDLHERWLSRSGVSRSDRSVHEHQSLCRILHYLTCYGQLNVPNLAGAEAANRRRSLIEYAHHGRPLAPDYGGSEELLGHRDTQDGSLVDPALTTFVAKRQGVRPEILKIVRLAKEERSRGGRPSQDGDAPAPKPPKEPKGGGRGKPAAAAAGGGA